MIDTVIFAYIPRYIGRGNHNHRSLWLRPSEFEKNKTHPPAQLIMIFLQIMLLLISIMRYNISETKARVDRT